MLDRSRTPSIAPFAAVFDRRDRHAGGRKSSPPTGRRTDDRYLRTARNISSRFCGITVLRMVFCPIRRPECAIRARERISSAGCRQGTCSRRRNCSTLRARIHQLAFRYIKNWEDAEEVTQDVLLKVYRKIDAFRGDAALSSWIYRITFNTAMSRLRTARASARRRTEAGARRRRRRPTASRRSRRTGRPWRTITCCAREMREQLIGALTTCRRFTGCR